MSLLSILKHRCRQPEVMDQPDLEERSHLDALRGLERINLWSGSSRLLWPAIRGLAQEGGRAPLRILDVATGGGDVPLRLWRTARRHNFPLRIEGCDLSPRAVACAQRRALEQQSDVRFFQLDALGASLPAGYDVLVSSLFLHHLTDAQAVGLLQRMAAAAARLVLINDLRRSLAGLMLAYLGTRLLSGSKVVHGDGLKSVRAAFTVEEARELARQAGLTAVTVEKRWPCRFLLTWRRA